MEKEFQPDEQGHEEGMEKPVPSEHRPSRLPLLLTIVSLLAWFGFQTVELSLERQSLLSLTRNLEPGVQEAQRMQAQLQTLLARTAQLANQGNPSARAAIAELQQKGIPIRADASP